MNFLTGMIGGLLVAGAFYYIFLPRMLEAPVHSELAELERARERFKAYRDENPMGAAEKQTGADMRNHQQQQADLLHTLERELEDIKQRVAMLMFKSNMGQPSGTGRPAQTAAGFGGIYEAEAEIIPPEQHPSAAHSDVASDLYDED